LHLADALAVHRGRTELRDVADRDVQLGGPPDLNELIPDRPLDGLGEFVAENADD
jgi:formyltetrahydrofolate deformylase